MSDIEGVAATILAGLLPLDATREESAQLAALCLATPASYDWLDAAVEDLCAAYVRGRLEPEVRDHVAALARSPFWRERLRFSRALLAELAAHRRGAGPARIDC
jgi:hypothetical protein